MITIWTDTWPVLGDEEGGLYVGYILFNIFLKYNNNSLYRNTPPVDICVSQVFECINYFKENEENRKLIFEYIHEYIDRSINYNEKTKEHLIEIMENVDINQIIKKIIRSI